MLVASNSVTIPCRSRKPKTSAPCSCPPRPTAAIDPCVGDGTALLEITKDTGAHLAGIELDADRAAAAADERNRHRPRQRL